MAVSPEMTFRPGDVVMVQGTVRYRTDPGELMIAVTLGTDRMVVYTPRDAITDVSPVLDDGDLVEHAASGREGLVRHIYDGLAWVAWSGRDENTVVPTADLVRRRTALEMAAVAEPAPLPAVSASSNADDTGPYVGSEGDR